MKKFLIASIFAVIASLFLASCGGSATTQASEPTAAQTATKAAVATPSPRCEIFQTPDGSDWKYEWGTLNGVTIYAVDSTADMFGQGVLYALNGVDPQGTPIVEILPSGETRFQSGILYSCGSSAVSQGELGDILREVLAK